MKTEPTINIQNEVAKIHSQFGMTEIANYQIEKLFEMYVKQSSPKIKQLEWILESGGWHISMTQFGVSYEIGESKNDGNFILYDILLTTTIHDTIDEAKAAAQAHFEKKGKRVFGLVKSGL